VDGFIVEGASAGGHNAPPRGTLQLDELGQPIYGPRDLPDMQQLRDIGLPFWMAGTYGDPGRLAEAKAMGAEGVQVGTAFAFCEESGMCPHLKAKAIELSRSGQMIVFTDPLASPTGFPFKVVSMDCSISNPAVYEARNRICDVGFLRHVYAKEDGSLGYRCPAEPIDQYVRKGGDVADTVGRKCICNSLSATVGIGQRRGDYVEDPIVTAGDDAVNVSRYLKPGASTYSAADVIEVLLS
jgi:nitronate monooxygenase